MKVARCRVVVRRVLRWSPRCPDNRLVEESYRRELRETPAAAADAADYEGGYEGEEEEEGGDDGGDDRGPAPPRRGQRDEEERPRKRRPLSSVEPGQWSGAMRVRRRSEVDVRLGR